MQGKTLLGDHYSILRQLGKGGDGTVYLVRHIPTGQLRAAKALKGVDPMEGCQELNMMKGLHHPSLPGIIDVLADKECVWLIMEFIRGRPLSKLKQEEINAEKFYSIARQLAEVLVYLHSRKMPVLHLDIKPSNVLLKADASLVLIDFGSSVSGKNTDRNGARYGTAGFAAPEQTIPGERLDERTDIYGYGATMYYCLYGRIPPVSGLSGSGRKDIFGSGKSSGAIRFRKEGWKRNAGKMVLRCMQNRKEKRFPDSKSLLQQVCRMERSHLAGQRMWRTRWAAGMLILVLIFTAGNFRQVQNTDENGGKDRYCRLLHMAKGVGFSQMISCYEEAAVLFPDDGDWCLQFLDRIQEDLVYSLEEEQSLKKLIFRVDTETGRTALEILEKYSEEYGEITYRMGILYWYYYEGPGGKQAAARWFREAVDSGRNEAETPPWLESAKIHGNISSYYEKLGKQDGLGKIMADYSAYWDDLCRLWKTKYLQSETPEIREQVAEELLACLIMRSSDLKKSGKTWASVQEILEELKEFIFGKDDESENFCGTETENKPVIAREKERRIKEQYEAANAAVKRVYADTSFSGGMADRVTEETEYGGKEKIQYEEQS